MRRLLQVSPCRRSCAPPLACRLMLAHSKGTVVETLDAEGWVLVHWAYGATAKYRYRSGAHDVKLVHSGFQAACTKAAACGRHSGQWRSSSITRYHCSTPSHSEGPLCVHGGGILQACVDARKPCAAFSPLAASSRCRRAAIGHAAAFCSARRRASLSALQRRCCPSRMTSPALISTPSCRRDRRFLLIVSCDCCACSLRLEADQLVLSQCRV